MTKTAFVTGITGQDGSFLAELLLNKDYNVIGLARSKQYNHNISHIEDDINIYYGDIVNFSLLLEIIKTHKPDEIYNLAAVSHIQDCWDSPAYSINVNSVAPIQMMDIIKKIGVNSKFLQATSREIYGNYGGLINEETLFETQNPYAISKLCCHLMLNNYRTYDKLFACSAILFNHESERRPTKFVTRKVTQFVANAKAGDKLKLGNMDAERDWGFAGDFVEGMWLMLQQDTPQDYVLATKTLHSIRDLCEIAFSHKGLNYLDFVESDSSLLRVNEVEAPIGDYSKAKENLGWEPKLSFTNLIKRMIDKE